MGILRTVLEFILQNGGGNWGASSPFTYMPNMTSGGDNLIAEIGPKGPHPAAQADIIASS